MKFKLPLQVRVSSSSKGSYWSQIFFVSLSWPQSQRKCRQPIQIAEHSSQLAVLPKILAVPMAISREVKHCFINSKLALWNDLSNYLIQLKHPWVTLPNKSNQVQNWRYIYLYFSDVVPQPAMNPPRMLSAITTTIFISEL